jgi:hypothetical protein
MTSSNCIMLTPRASGPPSHVIALQKAAAFWRSRCQNAKPARPAGTNRKVVGVELPRGVLENAGASGGLAKKRSRSAGQRGRRYARHFPRYGASVCQPELSQRALRRPGSPMGPAGCRRLARLPTMHAHVTRQAACLGQARSEHDGLQACPPHPSYSLPVSGNQYGTRGCGGSPLPVRNPRLSMRSRHRKSMGLRRRTASARASGLRFPRCSVICGTHRSG